MFGNALGNAAVGGIQRWQAGRADKSRRDLMQSWASEDDQQRQQMILGEEFATASQDLASANARVAALDAQEAALLRGGPIDGYWNDADGLEIDIVGGRLASDGENDYDSALLGLRSWMGDVRSDARSIVDNADSPFMAGLGAGLYAINSVTDAVVGGFVDTGRLLTSSEQRGQFATGMKSLFTTNPLTTAGNAWGAWSNLSAEDRLRYGAATLASLGAAPLSRGKALAELEDVIPSPARTAKPEFSGNWDDYTTHGIPDNPLASPEGIRLVNELEPLSYSRKEAIRKAEQLMGTGSTLPYANPIEVGDVFYKLVPEGGVVGAKSPYWFTESQIAPLRGLSSDQIASHLGLPLFSQQGSSFSLVSIRATAPGTSFTSRIAPTTELGAGGVLWQQSAGAHQTLLINRSLFTAPQVVKSTFP
ncbi:MAG: hypothetical protein ACREPE_03100 [Lysobacter sp.]